jgi:hypothetical protein
MSQEDLDVMRRWAETWNRTDLDAFADTFDDDAELITDPSWMEAGPFKGRASIRAWFEGLKESWDERDAVVLRELFEVGEHVIARIDWQVRGRTSGIDTTLDATSINIIQRGTIVRQQWFFDHAKALEAVGLSEQDAHADS